jgi:hypothetical protein
MGQRKLTREELQHVEKASWYLQSVIKQCGLIRGGGVVLVDYLNEIAAHGTTDGKPWIEPQPEIGEGYRLATEADNYRRDLEVWYESKWQKTLPGLRDGFTYRVPVDRIPTDEDAKGRPTVMVRDYETAEWKARSLLAVTDRSFPFVAGGSGYDCAPWRLCRFPYPGELN